MIKQLFLIVSFIYCSKSISQTLKLLAAYNLPFDYSYNNKIVGGISGIDYNLKENCFYLISDDRSEHDNARFYKASIKIRNSKIDTIEILSTIYLKNDNKQLYIREGIDCESIRVLKNGTNFLIGDEGGNVGQPGIRIYDSVGNLVRNLKLSSNFLNDTQNNKSFESLSLLPHKNRLLFATESPLKSDGLESDYKIKGKIRLVSMNYNTGKQLTQASYFTELLLPEHRNSYNEASVGLSEILSIDEQHFYALERVGVKIGTYVYDFDCKLFYVEIKKESLTNRNYITKKKEVFNFSAVQGGKRNFEGMCFGPEINHHKTLIIVSDNNFTKEPSTFILLQL